MAALTKSWISLLIALILAQTAASLFMPRGNALIIASDLIQGALLLVATAAFLPHTLRSRCPTRHVRLFWILMFAGMVLRLTYQEMWIYFEVFKRQEVPDPFFGDIVIFLHLVPMIAALALLPHLREDERNERVRMLDFTLLLTWWVFLYVYAVVPWQTVQIDEAVCSANLNSAYLIEKIVLLVALVILVFSARGGWRRLYGHLLGATTLYACSSYIANYAIAHQHYYSGSIYDIPVAVSIAWMGMIPVLAFNLDLSSSMPFQSWFSVGITRLSMLALFSIFWFALHAELDAKLPPAVKVFRITVALLAMVVMGVVVFWRQRLLQTELSQLLEQSRRSFDDLKNVQEKLIQSEKLASLAQLVGGAAHEINNPLTAMLGYSDLLSASDLPPQEKLQAAEVGEQVRRTTALVSSLLTFARQAPARLAALDINSLLQTAARLLAPQLAAEDSSIQLELAPALPPVLADSNQILRVCMHLATQITTHLQRQAQSTLLIRTHGRSNFVLVDFSAGDSSTNRPSSLSLSRLSPLDSAGANQPSTLSLSACCRIVEEHGGRLLQPSTPGHTAFRMELPIVPNSVTHGAS